jgi:prephenate dehydratase
VPGVPPTRFVYLGPPGTFAEQALRSLPAAGTALTEPVADVPEAFVAVRAGDADAALVPLENSVEGAVGVTLDQLAGGDEPLMITREVLLPVQFGLYGRRDLTGRPLTIASHPHALGQCREWLAGHHPDAAQIAAASTAEAAAAVARGQHDAALCATVAGEQHRLTLLAKDVGDRSDAVTRFVLLTRPATPPRRTGNDTTSLVVFISHDRTGALLEVLTEFAVRGINLTRIESRPTKERMGRYCFFLDCTGHVADARVGEALMGLRRICREVRFLGSYPRADREPPVEPPERLSEADFADAAVWLDRLRAGG